MLLRIAIAISNHEQEKKLLNKLIGVSMVIKTEIETMVYSNDFAKLINNLNNVDIAIMDYDFLNRHKDGLSEFFVRNFKCTPVVMGTPAERICDFLVLRPAEYIDNTDNINPENDEDKIRKLCCLTIKRIIEGIKSKSDNSVIYVTTRQESYAIAKESILYCQSDLKYTVFVVDDGMIIRKLSKLQDIENELLWDFKRVHQSFLINPKRVKGIDKGANEIILDGDFRVPYSKKFSKEVKDMFIN